MKAYESCTTLNLSLLCNVFSITQHLVNVRRMLPYNGYPTRSLGFAMPVWPMYVIRGPRGWRQFPVRQ
jgi:hypothetical protein